MSDSFIDEIQYQYVNDRKLILIAKYTAGEFDTECDLYSKPCLANNALLLINDFFNNTQRFLMHGILKFSTWMEIFLFVSWYITNIYRLIIDLGSALFSLVNTMLQLVSILWGILSTDTKIMD